MADVTVNGQDYEGVNGVELPKVGGGFQLFTAQAGTMDHRDLTHRTDSGQHPISAITGLQDALDGKQDKEFVITINTTDMSHFTADKTYAELRAAVDAGRPIAFNMAYLGMVSRQIPVIDAGNAINSVTLAYLNGVVMYAELHMAAGSTGAVTMTTVPLQPMSV